MRLIHDGRPSEALREDGQDYRRGDVLDVSDDRGEFLLKAQPVRLKLADAPGSEANPLTVALTDQTAQLDVATGEPDGNAPDEGADAETQREASTGEAQSNEGDQDT